MRLKKKCLGNSFSIMKNIAQFGLYKCITFLGSNITTPSKSTGTSHSHSLLLPLYTTLVLQIHYCGGKYVTNKNTCNIKRHSLFLRYAVVLCILLLVCECKKCHMHHLSVNDMLLLVARVFMTMHQSATIMIMMAEVVTFYVA